MVIVLCGRHTKSAVGVAAEIQIAEDLSVRYALVRGYKSGKVERPRGTSWFFDTIHEWTWDNLQKLTDTRPWWQRM